MKRNSSFVFISSRNATTPVPWVDNAPNFFGFSEPTLSVLQKAWSDFVASGEELEVLTEPIPVPPEPDWEGFLAPFYTSAGAGNSSPHDIVETKVQSCWLIASRISEQSERETAQHAAMHLQRHWSNCLLGITTENIRTSTGWLTQSWSTLQQRFNAVSALLPVEQQESCNLSAEEIAAIEALFRQFNLL